MNAIMNKSQLIDAVRDSCADVPRKTVTQVVDALFNVVQEKVSEGTDINLTGFGRFTRTERAARSGRNPQTGAAIKIPASRVPAFRPGKGFKEKVNGR